MYILVTRIFITLIRDTIFFSGTLKSLLQMNLNTYIIFVHIGSNQAGLITWIFPEKIIACLP